jgi:5-formyltetrahydrofolate cyclo-ligase
VAFDATGGRLGYGGGFYDRLLPLLTPGTPRLVGAYDLQIVPRVPASAHDLRVDTILTESRTLVATPG